MSLGYAEKLSFIEDVGNVGMAEYFDTAKDLQEKVERLASIIHKSKHLVVFTGAGISTSCGIPDFRGPKGIWTLQREGKPLPKASLPFHRAMPSVTHIALVELERTGILHYLISQNVDGLHLRSGIPRDKLSELHGNSFMESCPSCGTEYVRDFEVETIGLKETSRCCSDVKCGAKLRDTVLDWEDALPSKEMTPAEKHCKMADVVLCLGTSLQITPACNLPLKCLRGGGKIVIVNLQKTPKDSKACLVIHGYADKVIAGVMNILKMRIPPFIMIDFVHVIVTQSMSEDSEHINWTLRVANVHGLKFPLSFINSVEVSSSNNEMWEPMIIDAPPFILKRTAVSKAFQICLKLNLVDGCGCASCQIAVPIGFKVSHDDYDHKKEAILTNLRFNALHVGCCGQTAMIQRKPSFPFQSETSTYALLTNIKYYDLKPKLLGETFRVCSISGKRSNNRKRKSFL